jgi:anaerobic selenocysteine-containing dehydrogenase
MHERSRDAIRDPWGERLPYAAAGDWPVRTDQFLATGVSAGDVQRWYRSASLLHSNGDAMDIAVVDGRIVGVRGRAEDIVNRGRLGPKDLYGWQANASADRLTRPLVRGPDGALVATDWDTAMGRVVSRSQSVLRQHGPNGIAFYTSGQLFAEEYWTLAAIGHGAIGTNHLDGNTRLCTATAGAALKETFGCDGQPGSYADVDHADVIALYGHNVAETQPVLWMRILDRLAGQNPPRLLCVDPRTTEVARVAAQRGGLHLAPVPGTNLALLNGLLHVLIAEDHVDHAWVAAHTVGYAELEKLVANYRPERVGAICGLPASDIVAAGRLLGSAQRLLSTVLQGFYQSHQATAAAVAVNNVNLIRGMLGRPGAGILQMNGQPTAENTRECGADGDLAGFRNWANADHVAELAQHWNLDPDRLPHGKPPTHAMQIFELAELGEVHFLWISATNPAVSLPDLARIRRILGRENLFVVVQDIFPTETTQFADVVLPAGTWGEKTGCFTNACRVVHLSEKAIEPPGEARSDLDIFLDYARRMDFRDRDGNPFPSWTDAPSAFASWAASSAGRPCDYSGLSHELLRATPSGIQWPCNAAHPRGTERLYAGGHFWAAPEQCESWGRDLDTGEPQGEEKYRSFNPDGRAMLRCTDYTATEHGPDQEYPFRVLSGRTIHHFHTRTKTGRVPELQQAAPEVWVECCARDATAQGLRDRDLVELVSPHGTLRARLRVVAGRPGVLFVPFHYGYWDAPTAAPHRAANELTPTAWDPVSKQPMFKMAAAALRPIPTKGSR